MLTSMKSPFTDEDKYFIKIFRKEKHHSKPPSIYSRISEKELESPWFRPLDQEDWRI